jgi:hypothetical protein
MIASHPLMLWTMWKAGLWQSRSKALSLAPSRPRRLSRRRTHRGLARCRDSVCRLPCRLGTAAQPPGRTVERRRHRPRASGTRCGGGCPGSCARGAGMRGGGEEPRWATGSGAPGVRRRDHGVHLDGGQSPGGEDGQRGSSGGTGGIVRGTDEAAQLEQHPTCIEAR